MKTTTKNWLKSGETISPLMAWRLWTAFHLILVLSVMGPFLILGGCATQRTVVLDGRSDVVQLGPDVTGHIYVKVGGVWQLSDDKVRLPHGWFAGPFQEK